MQELNLNNPDILNDSTIIPNPHDYITIRGAKENNLKNISLIVPKNKLVVFSGLSGSGKSSLVFDTIYAEGQRRYVESLSAYARQFLGLKEKPDLDSIDGLSPAISIDQKSTSHNPRSTVGTITEIYDYLRLLFAKIGHQHCPVCSSEISGESVTKMVERILQLKEETQIILLSPLVEDQKGWHKQLILEAKKNSFKRLRVDGKIMLTEEAEKLNLNKQEKHSLEIVVDRLTINAENKDRLVDSLETSLKYGHEKAMVLILQEDGSEDKLFLNKNRACPNGHGNPGDLEPRSFSFNSPHGACPTCTGLGVVTEIDPDLVIPNHSLSIMEGAIRPLSRLSISGGWLTKMFETLSQKYSFKLTDPWKNLSKKQKEAILYGDGSFEGVINNLHRRYKETTSESSRKDIEIYMNKKTCVECQGARLKKSSIAVTVAGKNISEISHMPIDKCLNFFEGLYNNGVIPAKAHFIEEVKNNIISKNIDYRQEDLEKRETTTTCAIVYNPSNNKILIKEKSDKNSNLNSFRYELINGDKLNNENSKASINKHFSEQTNIKANKISKIEYLGQSIIGETIASENHNLETTQEIFYIETDVDKEDFCFEGWITRWLTPKEIGDKEIDKAGKFLLDHYQTLLVNNPLNAPALGQKDYEISRMILKEVVSRLSFLVNVGLNYLTISRSSDTLSGGEAQRIRLATQIGSGLTGVLYILDEPSIGLHQRDNSRLLNTLKHLRDLGNTVLVVEHDEETMREADFLVDIGPAAGKHGGQIVAVGTPEEVSAIDTSPTGRFLSGKDSIKIPEERRHLTRNNKKPPSLELGEEEILEKTTEYWINRILDLKK